MRVYKAPETMSDEPGGIFLAGSIDMGTAEDWQTRVCSFFESTDKNIYNPRRNDWDCSWQQHIEDPQFNQQVNWELAAMQKADLIIMNFLASSHSPITLLELGLYAGSNKLLVCCPDEYFRSGNVHIVCKNYNIPLFKDLDKLLASIKK